MAFTPLSQALATNCFANVRLIATDMDGTLTRKGKFTSNLLNALEALAAKGLPVLVVTGRSAGWVSGLASYLPVWGAIAENGGIVYPAGMESGKLLVPITDLTQHRQKLAEMFHQLQGKFPQLCETADNQFRLTDWTFDVRGLSADDLQTMRTLCQEAGWGFTYSTVQCHIKLPQQEKAIGLLQVLSQYFPDYSANQVLTVGDSPNDESMFDAAKFPLSIGVANVQHYRDQLTHVPAFVTTAAEGEGFCELAQGLNENGMAK